MKTLITALLYLLTINISLATVPTVLECSFPKLSEAGKLLIALNNFEGPDQIELNYDLYTAFGHEAAFSYKGDDLKWLWELAVSWDGQSVSLDRKGNLSFFLDAAGCDVGKIYLYGNNEFRFGYLEIDHYCSGPNHQRTYAPAKCQVLSQ